MHVFMSLASQAWKFKGCSKVLSALVQLSPLCWLLGFTPTIRVSSHGLPEFVLMDTSCRHYMYLMVVSACTAP